MKIEILQRIIKSFKDVDISDYSFFYTDSVVQFNILDQKNNKIGFIHNDSLRAQIDLFILYYKYHNQEKYKILLNKFPLNHAELKAIIELRFLILGSFGLKGVRKNIISLFATKYKAYKSLKHTGYRQIIYLILEYLDLKKELGLKFRIQQKFRKIFQKDVFDLLSSIQNNNDFYSKLELLFFQFPAINHIKRDNRDNNDEYKREEHLNIQSEKICGYQLLPAKIKKHQYKIYTRSYDQILHARDLLTKEDIDKIWPKLQKVIINKENINKRIYQCLKQDIYSYFSNRVVLVNQGNKFYGKDFAKLIANQNYQFLYKNYIKKNNILKDMHITFLIDNSGSMQGKPITLAVSIVYYIVSILEEQNISCEILGFTTSKWHGGKSYQKYKNSIIQKSNPGRVSDLMHVIYKSSSQSIRDIDKYLSLVNKKGFLKENIDGEAIKWACDRIKNKKFSQKKLIVISDGEPMDESTMDLNSYQILEKHMIDVLDTYKKEINIIGCGTNDKVAKYFSKFIKIDSYQDLGESFLSKFCRLLTS